MKEYLLPLLILLTGCATVAEKGSCVGDMWDHGLLQCNEKAVEIISDPPGARIQIDDDYIGDAPLLHKWHGSYDRDSSYVIKAYPIYAGQEVQTKYIKMEKLPNRIFFNMRLITK